MHTKLSVRLLAAALAVCALLGAISVASAASIADGSKTATISAGENQNYLPTAKGNFLKAAGYTYTTNDGLVGPAYCIDYGLMNTNKVLPITGKYTSHPATAGVFANGYPQHTLATFLELFLASNPVLEGLSEDEYMYATQVAVWASLGQLGVEGTAFTAGRNTIPQPSGDLRQMRVFRAVQLILFAAQSWTRVYQTGMYIRTEQSRLGGNITIPANMTLDAAAIAGLYGFKVEAIGGKSYYTREYIFASATSSYYNDYTLELWADGAPAGTMFTDTSNRELPKSSWHETQTWRLPVSETSTALNDNGSEYSGRAKLCIPTENVPTRGEITVRCAAQIMQYEIYLAYNDVASQQSYIIADPSKGSMDAEALLSWGSEMTELGSLRISKVGGGGLPLEGAEFTLAGTDGSSRVGRTNAKGMLEWNGLDPKARYTLTETNPPAGYSAVEPMDITIRAGHIEHVTIKDDAQHTLVVRKIDAQTGYSLRGAVIAFEQIDGSFSTTATTDHAGTIKLNADELPTGSYRVYEKTAPAGYLTSDEAKTIHWDAKRDMTLTFEDVRKPTLIISKRDSRTHYSLDDAVFEVYRDGRRVTTVTSGADGCAYVHDVSAGYYEVKEVTAPRGYIADSTLHGITIDPYDPATTDDPMLVIENDPMPSLLIRKYDRGSGNPLAGVSFKVYRDTEPIGTFVTDARGEILIERTDPGTYTVEELSAPDTHVTVSTPQSIELHAGDTATLVFFNDLKPGIHILKVDSETLKPLPNAVFRVESIGGSFGKEFSTDKHGEADLSQLEPGAYLIRETKAPDGYIADDRARTVQLVAGKDAEFVFANSKKPSLVIVKYDPDSGEYLAGASFRIAKIEDGSHYLDRITDTQGRITINDLDPGVYSVSEIAAPAGYIKSEREYHVELFAGETSELVVPNSAKPSLHIVKLDSITKDPIEGAKFSVIYASNNTFTGEINDLGSFYTDEHGRIDIPDLTDGWYRITETEAAPGYALAEPASQEIFIKAGEDKTVTFENRPLGALVIHKVDAMSGEPLGGARFRVRYLHGTSGTGGTVIGEYDTSANGTAVITGLAAGTYVVEEVRAPEGYAISDAPKTVYLSGDEQAVVTVEFADEPDSGLIVLKLDSDTRKPLAGAVFEVRSSDGAFVGTSSGRYTTDASGRIHLPNLPADTYIVREVQAPRGYSADGETQTVLLEHGRTHTLTFYNTRIPEGGLRVLKLDEHTGQPIEGVRFAIYHMDGRAVGSYRTNRSGIISLDGLTPGWYSVVETSAADGYELDAAPHDIEVRAGATATLEVTNSRTSSIVIRKVDSTTGVGLSGATFVLYDGRDNPIGEYRSDQRGYVYIDGLEDGRYSLREIEAPSGYVIDSERKTVYVRYGASSEVRWENTPITGQIQIVKRSADYCETTGLPAGSPLEGAVFEIYGERMGNLADTVRSGANGLAVTKQLPLGRYVVRESTAPNGYLTSSATLTAVLEYSGQIVRLEVENESVRTGVEIVKAGPKEIVSGQPMRYVLRSIANTSNVALDSFYWRDTLPAGVTADRLVTGRYDGSGSYKVLYRVGDGEYRVLADNLSAERSYTLSLSPATLGLAANERITEIMLVFGRVPSGFHAIETPMIYCTASKGLAAGASITNSADVGGMYGGKWVQAVSRWTTTVYGKPEPLPRAGY